MSQPLEGRVAIVTGAGRGIGRATALALAARGARVVVNDLGGSLQGDAPDATPAASVVEEIRAAGGESVANADSVATWSSAQRIIETALDTFGRLDLLVNNAGLSAIPDRTETVDGNERIFQGALPGARTWDLPRHAAKC